MTFLATLLIVGIVILVWRNAMDLIRAEREWRRGRL
jgi:hypothetical protein